MLSEELYFSVCGSQLALFHWPMSVLTSDLTLTEPFEPGKKNTQMASLDLEVTPVKIRREESHCEPEGDDF